MNYVINLIGTVLTYPLALVLPKFAVDKFGPANDDKQSEVGPWLPDNLSWFQTPGNNLYGNADFQNSHKKSYWSEVQWLWLNPFAGFKAKYLK